VHATRATNVIRRLAPRPFTYRRCWKKGRNISSSGGAAHSDRTSFFTTDGTAADNHIDQSTVPTTSRWDGQRLVTEYTIGPDITLVYSYTVVENMKRLVVRIERKDGQNTRQFDPDVYLLYRRAS